MTDELVAVSALNGEITIGDKVAVAVGAGRHGGGMRVGEVLAFRRRSGWPEVHVRVEQSSGTAGWHYTRVTDHYVPEFKVYTKWYDDPKRMVKL